jgi:NAD(P)-dependent dehydrogenase (short-subunit alcohol dehydrogenase family)
MADLEGKHIIVTGAGSGIGRATSILAAAQGADVLAVDLNDAVEETVASIKADGGRAIAVQADVSD